MEDNIKRIFSIGAGIIVVGFICGIGPARGLHSCSCSSDNEPSFYEGSGGGYSPSFKGSEASKYNGKKCGVWMSTDWCDCYGCASSNRDPFICSRCGHRCDKHTR